MSLEAFQKSDPLSLGVELELQLVNTHDYDLAPYAEDMLRLMKKMPCLAENIQDNTSVCPKHPFYPGTLRPKSIPIHFYLNRWTHPDMQKLRNEQFILWR